MTRSLLRRRAAGWLLPLAAALALSACADSGPTTPKVDARDTASVLIPGTTEVLDAAAAATIASVDSARLVFSAGSAAAGKIEVGDVVVSGITPTTPHGLLRKVTAKQTDGGQIVLQTEPGKLTDAIERGSGSVSVPLQLEADQQGQIAPGLSVTQLPLQEGFTVSFHQYEVADSVYLTGSLTANPTLDVDFDIDGFTLNEFVYRIRSKYTASIDLTAKTSRKSTYLDKTWPIKELKLRPIVLLIGVPPLAVPVVVVPTVEFRAGASGTVSTSLSASIQSSYETVKGARYKNQQWTTIDSAQSAPVRWKKPKPQVNMDAKAFVGPRFGLSLYDPRLLSGSIATNVYARVEAKLLEDPWWNYFAGVEAVMELESKIFDDRFIDLKATKVLKAEKLVLSGYKVKITPEKLDSAKLDSAYTFTARMKFPPKRARYTWNFGDGSAEVVKTGDSTATHAFTKAGHYTVSVKVFDEEKQDDIAEDTASVILGNALAGVWDVSTTLSGHMKFWNLSDSIISDYPVTCPTTSSVYEGVERDEVFVFGRQWNATRTISCPAADPEDGTNKGTAYFHTFGAIVDSMCSPSQADTWSCEGGSTITFDGDQVTMSTQYVVTSLANGYKRVYSGKVQARLNGNRLEGSYTTTLHFYWPTVNHAWSHVSGSWSAVRR